MWNTRGQFKPFDWQLPVEYFKILFKHRSCISFRANITICKHLCHINIHRVISIVSFWWFLTHQGSINIMSVVCSYRLNMYLKSFTDLTNLTSKMSSACPKYWKWYVTCCILLLKRRNSVFSGFSIFTFSSEFLAIWGLVVLVLQCIFAPKTCFFETLECV